MADTALKSGQNSKVRRKTLSLYVTIPIILIAVILAQEMAVRLAMPDYNPANHLKFPLPGPGALSLGTPGQTTRLIKNSGDYNVLVTFNKYGLRDDQDIKEARAEDLIFVGDSFVFGWGVEETERMSERLAGRLGRRVFNVGVPASVIGYGKLLEYAKQNGAVVNQVIVAINMGSDIYLYPDAEQAPKQVRNVEPASANYLMKVKVFFLHNSSIYFLATSLFQSVDWLKMTAIEMGLIKKIDVAPNRQVGDEAIARTARLLKDMQDQYPGLTVLIIPIRTLWIGNKKTEERHIHDGFINALKAYKIDVVDMRPVMEATGAPASYHFRNDGHWNPKGHDLAAKTLAEHLRR